MAKKKVPTKHLNEEMVFDLEQIVVSVKVANEEYELREATGDAACRWRNAILSKTTLGPDGKPQSVGAIADTEPILVSLCLFPKGSDKNVPVSLVRSWPSRIQKALFEKAKEISELDDVEDEEPVKNELEGTLDG